MAAVCGLHPTTDEARRFISLCPLQSWKCLRQYDSQFDCPVNAKSACAYRRRSRLQQERLSGAGTLKEYVDECPRLCGPVVCTAGGGEAIDGAQQVHGINVRAKITARDGAAGERAGGFFHNLRGLLKHP